LNAVLAAVLVPLTNLLNAIGKIKITLYFMILWTVMTWVLTPLAISLIGFSGFPLVSALVNISVVGVVFIAKRFLPFSVIKAIRFPTIAASIMGVSLYVLTTILPENFYTVAFLIIFGF